MRCVNLQGTFYRKAISIMRVIFNFILDYSNKKEDD